MSENTPTPPTANLFKPSEIIGILRNHLATGHVGKTMTVMMPIMIENLQNDYTFTFNIDKLLNTATK